MPKHTIESKYVDSLIEMGAALDQINKLLCMRPNLSFTFKEGQIIPGRDGKPVGIAGIRGVEFDADDLSAALRLLVSPGVY